jgi:hypothetical protein
MTARLCLRKYVQELIQTCTEKNHDMITLIKFHLQKMLTIVFLLKTHLKTLRVHHLHKYITNINL